MPIDIDGVTYYAVSDVTEQLGVSRQTLWRWKKNGKVPAGRRMRNNQVVFTKTEFDSIRMYANAVEPIDPASENQLRLFAVK